MRMGMHKKKIAGIALLGAVLLFATGCGQKP